eukprot:3108025-Pyramimonas_sp.AAC.1
MEGDLRSVIGGVVATVLAPLEMPAAAAAVLEGKDYHKAAKELRGDHKEDETVDTAQLGGPRFHGWKDPIRAPL